MASTTQPPEELKEYLLKIKRQPKLVIEFPASLPPQITPDLNDSKVFVYDFVIRYSDIDLFNHVQASRYLDYFEDTRRFALLSDYFKSIISSEQFKGLQVVKVSMDHTGQAKHADRVKVIMRFLHSEAEERLWFDFIMKDDDNVYCKARILYGVLVKEKQSDVYNKSKL